MKKIFLALFLILLVFSTTPVFAINRPELPFNIYVHVDGTSTTFATNTTTGPFLWGNSTSYNLAATIGSLVPTSANSVTSSDGTVVSNVTVGLLGAITFTWASAPTTDCILSGNIVF
jgi:hypothetical protein